MKTKDFIKMLQKADPEGEGYVRLPDGGAPWFAENKPGYWDGSYEFIENPDDKHRDQILATSTAGYKVDIYCLHIDDIIWEEKGDMNKIHKRLKFDSTFYDKNERTKAFWDHIEEEAKYCRDRDEEFLKKWYIDVVDEFFSDSTWEIRQPLDKPIGYYNCMTAHAFLRPKRTLNQGQCDILIRSGNFYPEKKEKYYVWHHDPEKGKNWSLK